MNRALQGLYPPGSTFKLVSLSALLRAGIVNQESQFNCTGSYTIGPRSFKCANHWGHGSLRTIQALQLSCNPFFWHFALQLGANKLHDEACFYHLDQPTGIDLPYETSHACIPSPQWKWNRFHDGWARGDTANMTIGQGYVLVTPLQMASFTAALAQNRNCCIPYLVQKKSYATKQALPKKDWDLIKAGMAKAGHHYLPDFKVAIKTGTAQVKAAGGLYTHIGWMVGFTPIENPQIAFCIAIEQETTEKGFWGGKICAPIAEHFLRKFFTNNCTPSKALSP
jgi:penicillin-binding protein 2